MTDDTIHGLKQVTMFRDLPDDMLAALDEVAGRRSLEKDEALFQKGDAGDSLFTIGKGRVKIVTKDAAGAEIILNQCGPGEVIGDMSLFDQEPRSAGVIALESVEVMELKRDALLKLLDQHPEVAMSVIRGMSHRLRDNTTYIQKAIEWSKKIAAGDFSFTEQTQSRDMLSNATSEDRIGQFLSAFFTMARNVKKREEDLKKQVEKLTIQIDEERRKKEFEELTSTDFYANLKQQAKTLRAQRKDNE